VLDHIRTQEYSYLKLYLTHLLIEIDSLYNANEFVFFDLKQIFSKLTIMNKLVHFKKIYFDILTKFNISLLTKTNSILPNDINIPVILNNKMKLLNNYILIANHRLLSPEEEQLFINCIHELYNNESNSKLITPEDLTVNVIHNVYFTNKIFTCKYSITQPLYKHKFNLIKFDIELSSELTTDKLPLHSIEVIFDNNEMNKTFLMSNDKERNFISNEHTIKFSHSVILKNKNDSIFLSKIKLVFDFITKVGFYIERNMV
jgi:hypothetical protein